MALTTSYLTSLKNLDSILNSIISVAPERLPQGFWKIWVSISNDRLYIGMFKALGLQMRMEFRLNATQFLDPTRSRRIIAEGIRSI